MKKKTVPDGKSASHKGGYRGARIWTTHRLEGVNENRATKMVKKPKKGQR